MKMTHLIIAAIFFVGGWTIHHFMPKNDAEEAIESVAEEVIKDETGMQVDFDKQDPKAK